MKTIVTKIEDIQKEIEKCEHRLDVIKKIYRLTDITDEEWKTLQQERKELEEKLVDSYRRQKRLRWENMKTMLVSTILLGIMYLLYTSVY